MKYLPYIPMICLSLLIVGCSSAPKIAINHPTKVTTTALPKHNINWRNHRQTALLSDEEALHLILKNLGETGIQPTEFKHLLTEVTHNINRFKGPRKHWFQQALSRAEKYMPMIDTIFSQKKIPQEMAWLALIESGFTYDIKSWVGARGIWQFMPQTAREYGLKVTRKIDQRTDPYRATLAARDYLLHRVAVYGANSFLLVAASYNAGEGGVSRALRKLEDPITKRNFIGVRRYLPKETQHYVPQLLAAAIIARNPPAYGFTSDIVVDYRYIQLGRPMAVTEIAQLSHISVQTLRQLNPELAKKHHTPVSNYIVRVPAAQSIKLATHPTAVMWWQGDEQGQRQTLLALSPKTDTAKPRKHKKPPKKTSKQHIKISKQHTKKQHKTISKAKPKGLYIRYKVQRNNRLSDISRWFKTSIAQIKAWNPHISPSGRLKKGQIITIYGLPRTWKKSNYRVQSGDSISMIAQRYAVSQKHLSAWNGIQRNRINKGQKLVIYYQKPARGKS